MLHTCIPVLFWTDRIAQKYIFYIHVCTLYVYMYLCKIESGPLGQPLEITLSCQSISNQNWILTKSGKSSLNIIDGNLHEVFIKQNDWVI